MIKQSPRFYREFIVDKCYLFSVRPTEFEPVTLFSGDTHIQTILFSLMKFKHKRINFN